MNHRFNFRQPAQSLAEFAFALPVLLMLVFALVEFGTVFSVYVGLTNSAREAARAGSIYQYQQPAAPNPLLTYQDVDAERAAAMDAAVTSTLNPLINAAGVTATYSYDPATPSSNNYRYGDKVTVTLSYTHHFFVDLLGESITLSASSEMRLEPGGR